VRDRSRSAGARAPAIGATLRLRSAQGREEAQRTVTRVTGELADLAERAAADADRLLTNARRALRRAQAQAEQLAAAGGRDAATGRRRGRLRRAVNDLTALLAATRRVAAQGRQRLAGTIPDGATRRVSLHDGDARPIAKGRLGKPVEFGYKAQVLDNDDGVVLDHSLQQGNPPDAPQLAPAVERVIARTGRRPRTVTADRGYGEASIDDALHALGVRTVVIPRKGKPGKVRQATEHRRAFRKTIKTWSQNSTSEHLFAQDVGVTAMVGQFAQNLQVHPVQCAGPGAMARHDSVQREVGHGRAGRRAGLPVGRLNAGSGVVVSELEGLLWTVHQAEFQTGCTADALLEPHSLHPCDVLE